jgi:N-acyl-D-amino-acid deacylase
MTETGSPTPVLNVIVRGGTVYDGSGGPPYVADVGVAGDRIASIGPLAGARAGTIIDAAGMAVAPGFINMLSHSYHTMLHDPRSLSELTQGVTTQVFGEGYSMGPLTPRMKERMIASRGDLEFDVPWTTLADYLARVERRGVSQNVASYIGATTLRVYAVGQDDRPATDKELDLMRELVRQEMAAGALGIGSSLIYPPAFFASTEELIELCKVAAEYRGKYISHMRSEGDGLLDGVAELIRISRESGAPAEIYHLKAAGRSNWDKMDQAIAMIEEARAQGLKITADMYTYTAGATGLSNSIPPWFHDGGPRKLLERLEQAEVRHRVREAIETVTDGWENLYQDAGSPDGILVLSTRKEENRKYQGKRLSEIAAAMGKDPMDALMDLVRSDRSSVFTAYFIISEDNIRKQIQMPWVAFGSDAGSIAAEGVFLKSPAHPRAYGCFARLLGKYVREERVIPLEEAIRRLSRLPADNLELDRRGRLVEGYYADIVVFDPRTVGDRATYEQPHQYSVGVRDVIINGKAVLKGGRHTGVFAGRALYGPGKVP